MAQELGGLFLVGYVDAGEGEQRVDEDDVGALVDDELTEGGGKGGAGGDGVAEDGEVEVPCDGQLKRAVAPLTLRSNPI